MKPHWKEFEENQRPLKTCHHSLLSGGDKIGFYQLNNKMGEDLVTIWPFWIKIFDNFLFYTNETILKKIWKKNP